MTEPESAVPANLLMEFILGLLAPLLMAGSINDLPLARLAATEAITAYKARGNGELVTIGQILGFALIALDNLRLSMPTDLSLSMKLKLRGSANALNRSALHSTEALDKARRADPSLAEQVAMSTWDEPDPTAKPEPPEIQPPEIQPKEPTPDIQPPTPAAPGIQWANAMKTEAATLQAAAAHLPPNQRKTNALWIEVLNGVALDITQASRPLPRSGLSKSELMRTTLIAGSPGFPSHLIAPPSPGRQKAPTPAAKPQPAPPPKFPSR